MALRSAMFPARSSRHILCKPGDHLSRFDTRHSFISLCTTFLVVLCFLNTLEGGE